MESINEYGILAEHGKAEGGRRLVGMHEHPFYECYFLLSGTRRYLMKHTVYDVCPADLLVVPRHVLHRATTLGRGGYDRYVLYFSDAQAAALSAFLGDEAARFFEGGCFHLPEAAAERVHAALEEIVRTSARPDGLTAPVLTHLLQEIALTALRYGTRREQVMSGGADKVQAVTRYVSEHYGEEITLTSAAAMACLERTYFSRRFKQLTGFGFQEYLQRTRVLAACRLLLETALPVGEIAARCGFASANYFGDVFLRYQGLSPSDYRRRNRPSPLIPQQ
ncbi:MAG: helix-turn-helix domain-containing protein [Clostridia bacterium]|nr:helix-turn-helix domain-containing protein [Clostridia bacterium]